MTISRHWLWCRLALAAALVLPAPLAAQRLDASAAGRQLTQHLNTLATDAQNVRALIGAGEAALALDDANAAIGFFGRADGIDPRNPRIKAGLGRALVMLERPRDALRLFDAAKDLGMAEAELAPDRGLAYDLRGDPKRAQRDYAIALRRQADPEVTRRLALSLAISGEREEALKLLAPLTRQQDRAAWRAQAFVMAMTGDVDGANGVMRTMMPSLARPMFPFFARLGGLSPEQKALAVHFGTMPSDGRSDGRLYAAAAGVPSGADGGLIPAGDPFGPRAEDLPRAKPVLKVSKEPRRRPGATVREQPGAIARTLTPVETKPAPTQVAKAEPKRAAPIVTARTPPPPMPKPAATTGAVRIAMADLPAGARAALERPRNPVLDAVIDKTREEAASPGFSSLAISAPAPQPAALKPAAAMPTSLVASDFSLDKPQPAKLPATAAVEPRSLAAIVGSLELEQAVVVPPPVPAARKPEPKPVEKAKPVETKVAAKPDPKKSLPERVWAQVATGSDKKALASDYGRFAKKSPAAFKGVGGWTAPFKATRRLLVGPFTTEKKAQEFLKVASLTGFAWTSPAGQEVEKLPGK